MSSWDRSRGERCEAQQSRVIAKLPRQFRLGNRLRGFSTNACNLQETLAQCLLALTGGFGGEIQDRRKEADVRIADRKLSGVDADGDSASARLAVIARKRALAPLVKFSL